ncbi:MAG: hypothetical protein ACR2KQ_11270 [Actinomycetota bacterium]
MDKRPILENTAKEVFGEVVGRTLFTRAAPETTDDEASATPPYTRAANPTLIAVARGAEGHVVGRTRITATPETTDDESSVSPQSKSRGDAKPVLAVLAKGAPGRVHAGTIVTFTRETTDDEP